MYRDPGKEYAPKWSESGKPWQIYLECFLDKNKTPLLSYATGYGIGDKSGSHNLRRMKIMEVLNDRTFQGRVPRWFNFFGQGGFWPSVFLQGNSGNTH